MKPAQNVACEGWKMLTLEDTLAAMETGTLPLLAVEDCAGVLQKCRKEKNPVHVSCLLAYMRQNCLDSSSFLGNNLISVLVEIGWMDDAHGVFNKLEHPYQSSWNLLITGYVKHGDEQQAFHLYEKMQLDGSLRVSGATVVALLKSCTKIKDLGKGSQIHAHIANTNKNLLEKDVYVGSALVDMYAKCGSLTKAHEVLDMLPFRDAVSWTALISGYLEHGCSKEALTCFEQMQYEGVSPDPVTYSCTIKACTSLRAIEKGQKLHVELSRNGLERHSLVGNALVDMYAKFGFLVKAQEVFDNISARTVVSWTSLIAAYADHGCGKEALDCLKQMHSKGVSPDCITFACSLKACGSIGSTSEGQEIHIEVTKRGLESMVLASTLVDMYAKSGSLAEAYNLLNSLTSRDVVLWTALIAGYVEQGHGEAALKCFVQMQEEGISPDDVTFACSLKACGSIGAAEEGREIHKEIKRRGLEKEHFVGNCLIDMYAKCGLLLEAWEAFDMILSKDVVSWTALMTGFVEHGCFDEALDFFEKMCDEGISPDVVCLVCGLKASGGMKTQHKGEQIYTDIVVRGLEGDLSVGSSLVDMYGKCGLLVEAQEVFDKLEAQNVVAWNALIGGYVEHGLNEVALELFDEMHRGVSLHAVTFLATLKACGSLGALDIGQGIHTEIVMQGLDEDLVVGNSILDIYAKCGFLGEAQKSFDSIVFRDDVSWNALIAGYSQLGDSKTVFSLLDKMVEDNTKPNAITFMSVLNACSNAGQLGEGQVCFKGMQRDFDVLPTLEQYNCIVDLLGRLGLVDLAVAFIQKVPFIPGIITWHSVLGACQKSGDVDLGRQAFKEAMLLDETDVSSYVAMSNIYSDAL